MITEAIRDNLKQVSFHPFVIRASSGHAYRILDPELLVLMKSKVFVAQPNSDRAATIP